MITITKRNAQYLGLLTKERWTSLHRANFSFIWNEWKREWDKIGRISWIGNRNQALSGHLTKSMAIERPKKGWLFHFDRNSGTSYSDHISPIWPPIGRFLIERCLPRRRKWVRVRWRRWRSSSRTRRLDWRTKTRVSGAHQPISLLGKKVQEYVQNVKKVYTGKVSHCTGIRHA